MIQSVPNVHCKGIAIPNPKSGNCHQCTIRLDGYSIDLLLRGIRSGNISFNKFNHISFEIIPTPPQHCNCEKDTQLMHELIIKKEDRGIVSIYALPNDIELFIDEFEKLKDLEFKEEEKIRALEKAILNAPSEINNWVNDLIKCDFVKKLIMGFILNQNDLFVKIEKLRGYELSILAKFSHSIYTYSLINTYDFVDNSNECQEESLADFIKLVKIIHKRYTNLQFDQCLFSTWITMKRLVTMHYASKWEEESGQKNSVINIDTKGLAKQFMGANLVDYGEEAQSLYTYFIASKIGLHDKVNLYALWDEISAAVRVEIADRELESYEMKLLKASDKNSTFYSIHDTDLMTGGEFEGFIEKLFQKTGYKTKLTKTTGDQGVDIIVEKNNTRYGIQTKCYTGNVPNTAIQEVVAGIRFHNCSKGIVITNNYFTKAAVKLAEANNVVLWDRDLLKLKIDETFNK